MTTVIVFVTSGVLLVILYFTKRRELARGTRFGESVRALLDRMAARALILFGSVLPHKITHAGTHFSTSVVHLCTVLLLHTVRGVERRLVWAVNFAGGRKRQLQEKRTPSSFLEDVHNHKREVNGNRKNGYFEN